MALRGKKPTEKPRLRALVSGEPGAGKSIALCQFLMAYLIDNETGLEHYGDTINANGGVVFDNRTGAMAPVIEEIHALMSEPHDYVTLGIDPLTVIYEEAVAEGVIKKGDSFGRHHEFAGRQMARLMRLVSDLDMNVVFTSHSKAKYKDGEYLEDSFDGWKKSAYVVDVHFHIERRETASGIKRIATVRKTRLGCFPDGDSFEWSYDEIARRYGRDKLERKAELTTRASAEQVAELAGLLSQLDDAGRKRLGIDRALRGYAENLADLPEAKCAAGIKAISNYLNPVTEAA